MLVLVESCGNATRLAFENGKNGPVFFFGYDGDETGEYSMALWCSTYEARVFAEAILNAVGEP